MPLNENSLEPEPIKALNNAKYGSFHARLIFISALGAFVDLYVIQVLGASTFSIIPHFLKSTTNFAFTASVLFIGAFIGTLSLGIIVDRIGRRSTFLIMLLLATVLSIISAFVQTPLELDITRFLLGIVTGAVYPAAMAMVSEFTPAKYRGRGMSYLWVSFTLGGVAAYLLGYFLLINIGPTPIEWRILLGSPAVPAGISLILSVSIPESPRWLIEKGKFDKAAEAIKKATGQIFSTETLANTNKVLFLDKKVEIKRNYSKYSFLLLLLVIAIFGFNLIPGALATLNPFILSSLGISHDTTLLYSASFLGIQVISTFMIARTIESVGRYRWALIGGGLEALFALMVILIYHNALALYGVFMGLSFFAFVAIPVIRNAGSEFFPTEFRGFSSGIIMAGDRGASVVGLLITPVLFSGHNVVRLFSVYGVVGAVGTLMAFIALRNKHIEGKSLEEIQSEMLE